MSTEHLLGDIGTILGALTSSDNAHRQEAEERLRTLTVAQPAEVLLLLAQVGSLGVGGFQLDDRFLALVLLGRVAFRETPGIYLNEQTHSPCAPFDVVAERTRARIESALCTGLKDEVNPRMRKGMGVCCATWTEQSAKRQRPFLPLPPALLELTQSPNPFHRFTSYQLLGLVPTLLVDSVREPIPVEQIAQLVLAGLHDSSLDVKVEAMKAMRGILIEGLEKQDRDMMGPQLVAEALKILYNLPKELLSPAVEPLVALASSYPDLFLGSLETLLPFALALISPPAESCPGDYAFSPYPLSSLDYPTWETLADPMTELVISLVELRPAEAVSWQHGRVIRDLTGLLLGRQVAALSADGEECEEWLERENFDEEDVDYSDYSEIAFDRLSQTFLAMQSSHDGSRAYSEQLLAHVIQHTSRLLERQEWRSRYTPLVTIAAVAEGCSELLRENPAQILALVDKASRDPHPRVRYAWLHCIGQLCTDLEGDLQEKFAREILGHTATLLEDPAIRAHAAACLTNFFQNATMEHFGEFLPMPMKALLGAYYQGPLAVQENVLGSLTNIAAQAGSAFVPYYQNVMSLLMETLKTAKETSHRKLIGRAIETATYTGLAVGKQVCATDAIHLAGIMIAIQNELDDPDDPRASYIMNAWYILLKCLGRDFYPFLPHVVPPLLKAAAFVPAKQSAVEDEEDFTHKVESAEMDGKVTAFDNLALYAYQLQGDFAPWLNETADLALAALQFQHSERVRESAAFLVPGLLQVAKSGQAATSPQTLQHIFKTLMNAIVVEEDYGFLTLLYKSYNDSLLVVDSDIPPELSTHFIRSTADHLADLRERRADRLVREEHMSWDEKQGEQDDEQEEDALLDTIGKCVEVIERFAEHEPEVKQGAEGLRGMIDRLRDIKLSAT